MAIKSFLSEGGFSVGSVGSAPIEVIDSSGNITAVGLTVSGNLVVNGSTTTINSTTTTLDDPIITLGGDTVPTSDDNKDRGIEFRWHDGSVNLAKVGFFGFDDSTGKFVFIPNATNTSEVFSGTKGTIDANLEWADVLSKPSPVITVTLTGDVTGTANTTLTSLGNGTITINTTVNSDAVALGTDTTGAYVLAINNGSYLTGGNGPSGSESAVLTLGVDATSANTASKVVARDASGNFSAGAITATGMTVKGASTLTQLILDTTTSGSKEIVFYDAGVLKGYVWNSGSVIGMGGGSGNNSLFVNTTTGNTGVGTNTPGGRLEVNFTAATGATALILRTSDSGGNGAIRWQNSGGTNQAGIGSNFNVSDVGALEFLNGTTTNVIFRSSGNVGIGKTNPQQKLHIAGTNARIAISNDADNNWAEIGNDGASGQNTLEFFTGSSSVPAMSITHANNVGIGTTAPGSTLQLGNYTGNPELTFAAVNNGVSKINFYDNNSTEGVYIKSSGEAYGGQLIFGARWDDDEDKIVFKMYQVSGGASYHARVGIGTTSPTQGLHLNGGVLRISGGATGHGEINLDSGTEYDGWQVRKESSTMWGVKSVTSGNDLAIFVDNTTARGVYIKTGGNVGINQTNPSHKLDVGGSIRTTDWLYIENSGYGMYSNASGLYLSTAGNNWDISSGAAQTWAGLRLYTGGKNVTWRGHFYGDSSGQGFLDSGGNWQLIVDSSSRLRVYAGVYNMDQGIRVLNPGGAAYSTNSSTVTGAWKIKLPTDRFKSNTMMRMTIKIYRYSTGTSTEFNVGGYNYSDAAANWYNVFAEQQSDLYQAAYTIRFGNDGTANCIWIGETNSTWDYPQVFVTDFEGGYSGTTQTWASGWSITPVTAFDTVTQSRTAAVQVNSNNIGNFGVNYITGTANQVLVNGGSGANVTGGVTLTLPQNIHTTATPTFSSLTLSGDVLTLSGSGVAAYTTNAARIYNQTGVGVTVNANTFEVRTGTSTASLALSVSNTQNTTLAGNLTVSGTAVLGNSNPDLGAYISYGTDVAGWGGIWFRKTTKSAQTMSIGSDTANTVVNAATGGSVFLRVSNGTGLTVTNVGGSIDTTIAGNLTINGTVTTLGTANGSNYILTPGTDTSTGVLALQAGQGSAGFGGGLAMFSGTHATYPGWTIAGLASGVSTAKFAVNSQGWVGAGTNVFTVDRSGNTVANGTLIVSSTTDATAAPAGSISASGGIAVGTNKKFMATGTGGYWGAPSVGNQETLLIRATGFGYNATSYAGVQIGGTAGRSIVFGVDVSAIAGGQFTGAANEWIIPNTLNIRQVTSAGTDFSSVIFTIGNGGATTIGGNLTVSGTDGITLNDGSASAILRLAGGGNELLQLFGNNSTVTTVQIGPHGATSALQLTSTTATLSGNLTVSGTSTNTFSGQIYNNASNVGLAGQFKAQNSAASATNGALSGAQFLSQPGYSTFIGTTGDGTNASYRSGVLANVIVNQQGYVISDAANGILFHSINGSLQFATGNTGARRGYWDATSLVIENNTASTSTTTGSLVVTGGIGVSGAAYIGGNLTVSGTGTINGTSIPASKTLVVTTDKLSVHAATTSAELAGVISDETGTGALVFANTPTLVTPNIGAATGTSVNLTGSGTFGGNVSITPTWNSAGTNFTALNVSVTDTASGSASNLFKVSGASGNGMTVDKNGRTTITADLTINNQNGNVTGLVVAGGNATFAANVTVSGNLIVNGTTTTVDSTTLTTKDPIITLGGGSAGTAASSDDNKDRGIEFKWYTGGAAKTGFFGFDDSTGYFTFIPDATNTSEVFSGTQGDIQAGVYRGTGASLTGSITESSADDQAITLNATDNSWKYLGFQWSGTRKAYFGINASGSPEWGSDVANTTFAIVGSGSSLTIAGNTVLHGGNYNNYTDPIIQALDSKASVKAATTADITLSGTQTIDGVALVAGDRVLVKNQNTQTPNGIYVVSAGAWTRATDFDTWSKLIGAFVFVEQGSTNGLTGWLCAAAAGGAFGSNPIMFSQFSHGGSVNAGTGLTKTTNNVGSGPFSTFSITNTTVSAASYGSASSVATFTVNAQGQLTAANSVAIAISSAAVSGLANSATITATSTNTANQIVLRDGSGNFSAGTITATLSGAATNASSVGSLACGSDFSLGSPGFTNGFTLSSAVTDTDQHGRYYYSGTGSIATRYLPVDKTGVYRMKIRWKASVAAGTYMAVFLLDTSGNQISGAGTYWAYPWGGGSSPTTWTENEYWYNGSSFPSNAAYVAFGISHTNYGGGSATYYVSQLEIERVQTQISGSTIWTAANDGSGSGLDADLLDGYNQDTANAANTIVRRDGSGNFTAGTITAALSGNASTATTWQTARNFTIGSTARSVNGSSDYSWTVADIGAAVGLPAYQAWSFDSVKTPGLYQYDGAIGATKPPDGSANYRTIEVGSSTRYSQIALPWDSDNMYFRRQTNSTWSTWRTVLTDGNYNSYAPTLTGTGASGTWGISITGNAATATTASNVNNGTLTLAVSGTGLSGSASFTANQSGNSTFTVTSNATSANAVSTIVARDSNGDFNSRNITLTGSLNAVTKSFVIKHPTKEGKKLRYGSLEGPENGIYVRGKLKGTNVIELPDYWTKLVDPESITVQLTPIGSHQKLYVEKIEDNKVYIANENLLAKAINCFFYVLAERCDVEKLEVEIDA